MSELLYWPLGSAERHRYGIVSAIRSLRSIDLSESLISKNSRGLLRGVLDARPKVRSSGYGPLLFLWQVQISCAL